MTFPFPADLQDFVRERMATGRYGSEEDLLRDAFHPLAEEEENLGAVREALAEWRAGDDGVSLDDAVENIRQTHHPR